MLHGVDGVIRLCKEHRTCVLCMLFRALGQMAQDPRSALLAFRGSNTPGSIRSRY